MYLIDSPFPSLLPLLPKNGIAAEIGVLKGDTSAMFLRDCQPARLHLIDPWTEQSGDYRFDSSNTPQAHQDSLFKHVGSIFAEDISAGRVILHRTYSDQAVKEFPERYFDWIYIDGDHTYNGVMSDLKLYAPKMKDTGFIIGDDFINSQHYLKMKFGVVEAVQDFIRLQGYELVLLTQDWRYVLSRPGNPYTPKLLQLLLMSTPFAVDIPGPEKLNYTANVVSLPNG